MLGISLIKTEKLDILYAKISHLIIENIELKQRLIDVLNVIKSQE